MSGQAAFVLAIVAGLVYLLWRQYEVIAELRARIVDADREADDVEEALRGRKRRA